MTRAPLVAVACALSALAGCANQTGGANPCQDYQSGDEPCMQQMYFPAHLAADPDHDVIYVASFNADLRFSGAALQAINVARFDCALEYVTKGALPSRCASVYPDPLNPGVPDPAQAAADTAVVTGPFAKINRGCQFDLLDPSITECDETPFIDSVVKIGNFAGAIKIQRPPRPEGGLLHFWTAEAACPKNSVPAPTAAPPPDLGAPPPDLGATGIRVGDGIVCMGPVSYDRRLWLPVRGDPSITWVEVYKPTGGKVALVCDGPINDQHIASCNGQRITVRDFHHRGQVSGGCTTDTDCPNGQSCDQSTGACTPMPLPSEPFGIALDEGPGYGRLVVAHLASGQISVINAAAFRPTSTEGEPAHEAVVLDVRGGFFVGDALGRRGAYSVTPLSPGHADSYWFVTSRLSPGVGLFRIGGAPGFEGIQPSTGFSLNGTAFLAGDDVRDVLIEPGVRAFFVENHPPSLFTADIRPWLSSGAPLGATPNDAVVDVVDVCQGPSHLAMRKWYEAGAPGEPPSLVTRLFVICTTSGQVWQVDPDLARVVAMSSTGRGPNSLDFNFDLASLPKAPPPSCFDGVPDAGESAADCGGACGGCIADPCDEARPCASGACTLGQCQPRRAWVANFTDSTIAVIDLQPGSPTRNRVIGRIGYTSPPFNQ